MNWSLQNLKSVMMRADSKSELEERDRDEPGHDTEMDETPWWAGGPVELQRDTLQGSIDTLPFKERFHCPCVKFEGYIPEEPPTRSRGSEGPQISMYHDMNDVCLIANCWVEGNILSKWFRPCLR